MRRPALHASLRIAYIGVLVLATLSPFEFGTTGEDLSELVSRALSPEFTAADVVDGARNVTLFAGWGIVWIATGARRHPAWRVALAALTGVLLSVSIESVQLFLPDRSASILDVYTNGAGSLIGAATGVSLIALARRRRGWRSFLGLPAVAAAGSYLATVLVEAVFPLQRHGAPGVHGGPLNRLEWSLDNFELTSLFAVPAFDLVLFFPAGALLVAAFVERGTGYPRAALLTAGAGLALSAVAEAAHGLLAQPIELGAILTHAAAFAAGGYVAARWLPRFTRAVRGRWRVRFFLVGYVAVLLLWWWRPFVPQLDPGALAEELSLRRWIPLTAHAIRGDLYSVADVARSFLLFFPIGAVLAVWPLRLRGALAKLFPALYLAAVVELGHILIAPRFFDVTDMLISAAGAAIGWVVIREAGFRPYGAVLEPEEAG